MPETSTSANLVELASEIVSAYVTNNSIPPIDLPALVWSVHQTLTKVANGKIAEPAGAPTPAVPIRKSVTPDYLISLFDGRRYRSLKRHLRTYHNMTPDQYRAYWRLPSDYPMVAPNFAAARSQLAKRIGLGQQRRKAVKGRRNAG
jgi:predicted transcriptional regulator